MPDSTDFFGAALRIVGGVLNVFFRVNLSNDPNMRVWTDDAVVTEMPLTPLGATTVIAAASTAPPQTMQQRAHDEIATLQQVDPDFSEMQFLAQATAQYQSYLAADGAMSADALRPIATQNFVDGYKTCVASWANAGLRRVVKDMKMIGSAIIKVSLDGTQQAIVVRFSSSGVRYTQDSDSGVATDGSAQPDTFTEFATFVRPAGVTTPKAVSAGGATHCPSCGAPTTAGAATCPFCGTQLTGTGGTWLLDKISASAYT